MRLAFARGERAYIALAGELLEVTVMDDYREEVLVKVGAVLFWVAADDVIPEHPPRRARYSDPVYIRTYLFFNRGPWWPLWAEDAG